MFRQQLQAAVTKLRGPEVEGAEGWQLDKFPRTGTRHLGEGQTEVFQVTE